MVRADQMGRCLQLHQIHQILTYRLAPTHQYRVTFRCSTVPVQLQTVATIGMKPFTRRRRKFVILPTLWQHIITRQYQQLPRSAWIRPVCLPADIFPTSQDSGEYHISPFNRPWYDHIPNYHQPLVWMDITCMRYLTPMQACRLLRYGLTHLRSWTRVQRQICICTELHHRRRLPFRRQRSHHIQDISCCIDRSRHHRNHLHHLKWREIVQSVNSTKTLFSGIFHLIFPISHPCRAMR